MATKKTGLTSGSKASSVLTSSEAGKASKSAAGSPLAQVKSSKETSAKAGSAAPKTLRDGRTSRAWGIEVGCRVSPGAARPQETLNAASARSLLMATAANAFSIVEGEVVDEVQGMGLVHVRATDGRLLGINRKTPGVVLELLRHGQRLRCRVTDRFHRVLSAEVVR